MFNILLALILQWKVIAVDYDDSIHKHVALLEGTDSENNGRKYEVSVESDNPFPFQEEGYVYAKIVMECEQSMSIDEAASDQCNCWSSYVIMGCNSKHMEIIK